MTASCLVFFMHPSPEMRDYDEEDPKKPQPVGVAKKRTNPLEGMEMAPWRPLKDEDRDRHRHI